MLTSDWCPTNCLKIVNVIENKSQQGFVLVSVLWLTVFMFAFAAFLGFYADQQLRHAGQIKDRVLSSLTEHANERTLIFLFATRPAAREGLLLDEELRIKLDDTQYVGLGEDMYFSVQDYGGLVPLNAGNSYHLSYLLESFGASQTTRVLLIDALQDYIDNNDTPRLNGKEAAAYRIRNMQLPSNEYLKTTVELRRVIGWDEWFDERPEFDLLWLSTNWRSRLNLNSAPIELLNRVLPLGQTDIQSLATRRSRRPFTDMSDVNQVLNFRARLDEEYFTFLPGNKMRFSLFSARTGRMAVLAVTFTPMSLTSSFEIDYRYDLERGFDIAGSATEIASKYFPRQHSSAEERVRLSVGRIY